MTTQTTTRKEQMTKWTLVQHSAWVCAENPQFMRAVEMAAITNDRELKAVESVGGVVFDSYPDDEEHDENYPPEVKGLIARCRGTFSTKKINAAPIYLPKRQLVGKEDTDER